MCSFVEDYPGNKAQALVTLKSMADSMQWCDNVDDDLIFSQLDSGEFRLYMEMVFCDAAEDSPRANSFSIVA